VKFENLTAALGGNAILESASARVLRGSCAAIVDLSGAGETTMPPVLPGEASHTGRPGEQDGALPHGTFLEFILREWAPSGYMIW